MNEKDFDLLLESVKEGGAILRKEREPARKFEFCAPDLKAIRKHAKTTQIEFARMIGVSVGTLRNWEQGRRTPDGPALALLKIASVDPEYIKTILSS
ncbi:MAG: helix-turn-helix domain-containing protein [Sphaerochaeta sp.]|nr:helix-turn-helix domain-containing protein [Sphaerochaeta sp.]